MTQPNSIEQLEQSINQLKRTNVLLSGGLVFCVLLSLFCLFKLHGPVEANSVLLANTDDSRTAKLTAEGLSFQDTDGKTVALLSRDSLLVGGRSESSKFEVTTTKLSADLTLGRPDSGFALKVIDSDAYLSMTTGSESEGSVNLTADREGSRLHMSEPNGKNTAWMMAMKEGAKASLTSEGKATWQAP